LQERHEFTDERCTIDRLRPGDGVRKLFWHIDFRLICASDAALFPVLVMRGLLPKCLARQRKFRGGNECVDAVLHDYIVDSEFCHF